MARAVSFDLDGTLLEYARPYDEILLDALDAAGVPDAGAVADAYGERFFERFGAFDDAPYRRALADAFAARDVTADPERAAAALIEAELDATAVPEGTRAALDRLAAHNDLGVLTNGVPAVQRRKLERHDLDDYFDAVVVSYDVGAHKPDPAIFAAARERLPADEHVHVGDDYEHDVAAAREAGFLAVHVDRGADPGVATVRDLDTLRAVGGLFGE